MSKSRSELRTELESYRNRYERQLNNKGDLIISLEKSPDVFDEQRAFFNAQVIRMKDTNNEVQKLKKLLNQRDAERVRMKKELSAAMLSPSQDLEKEICALSDQQDFF